MRVRSLPHFSHSPIGKTTHKKGKSYHHVNYITRDDACSKTLSEHMPADRDGARPYFEALAYGDNAKPNARVADTLIIALPLELTREQRFEAIAGFMAKIGHGRIAWIAAFHDKGKDEHNPHCHVIFRDADIETGRKVVGTTTNAKDVREAEAHGWRVPPRMTTKDLRVAWCNHLNAEMERRGLDVRFDQRRLKEQGIDREPQIHVGPAASNMANRGKAFNSQDRQRGNHANVYTLLDAGSRAEHNQRIIDANRHRGVAKLGAPAQDAEMRQKRELREGQRGERRAMYEDQARDRAALRAAHHAQKLAHERWGRALYAEARHKAYLERKEVNAAAWLNVRQMPRGAARKDAELRLKDKAAQKLAYDVAAETQVALVRPIKNAAWTAMKLAQEVARTGLQQQHNVETSALARQHLAERHALSATWQHQHLSQQADRINARLEARQGMVAVQATALSIIKHHASVRHAMSGNGGSAPVLAPLQASQVLRERAVAERATRRQARVVLNCDRHKNVTRATPRATRRDGGGQAGDAARKGKPGRDQMLLPLVEQTRSSTGRDGGRSGR